MLVAMFAGLQTSLDEVFSWMEVQAALALAIAASAALDAPGPSAELHEICGSEVGTGTRTSDDRPQPTSTIAVVKSAAAIPMRLIAKTLITTTSYAERGLSLLVRH